MIIGILGLGEVGSAISQLCQQKHQVVSRTRHHDELKGKKIDILHICIPYNQQFASVASKTIKELSPLLTIIDSTVAPGTTQKLQRQTKANLVHAPITGIHPHLYEYLKVFIKPLGASNDQAYQMAKKHFQELGVKTIRFNSPQETELAKLLCTTYYAWNIFFEKWVFDLCRKTKTDFNQVYSQWNKIYNTGYRVTKPNVIRPILKHVPGPIGGHCLMPNINILQSWLKNELTHFMLHQNRHTK